VGSNGAVGTGNKSADGIGAFRNPEKVHGSQEAKRDASPTAFREVEDENDDEDENDWGNGGRPEHRPSVAR
jgi:hypothetical protein